MVLSRLVRFVFGSLYMPPTSSTRPAAMSWRSSARACGYASQNGLR